MVTIKTPHTLYTPEKAEAIAAMLQADDPEWVYKAKHDPSGKGLSFVEIYEKSGEFIARM